MSTLQTRRKIIDAYRIKTTEAYRMDEIGTGYSLSPAGEGSRYYQQDSEPVKLSVPEDTEIVDDPASPDWLICGGKAYHLSEMLGLGLARVLTAAEHYA